MTEQNRQLALVVDDQQVSRQILERLLIKCHAAITVETFSDPRKLLYRAETSHPDLIITDYRMPSMDGVELTRHLRTLPSCDLAPILMVTVVDEEDVELRALEAGVNDFLIRPIDPASAAARCTSLLRVRERTRKLNQRSVWLQSQLTHAIHEAARREVRTLARLGRAVAQRRGIPHSRWQRIPQWALRTAREMDLTEPECAQIEVDAILYDIGMITVPDAVLAHKAKLTAPDRHAIEVHTEAGAVLLAAGESIMVQNAALAARNHHERLDGSGYPRGLRGEAIPLSARLLAVIDTYDAMGHARTDRTALDHDQIVTHLRSESGRRFDPRCVEAFLSVLSASPDGGNTMGENR